ncbi:type II secretion system protein [Planococcus ruber]|uniref:type II secretion system protein n=1 Tax=Planococcus ruber TaxID=2027871 RepID=UPI001FF00B35|nr:type II secretion system protein [Planococcus ruber]MCJ1908636.1 type II secretion system GspH family protein [Planococcus ruber]
MKNERGISLMEILAALAIVGIIMALAVSVFVNGSKASVRSTANQRIQQEANYIVEAIRSEYLKNSKEPIKLEIKSGGNPEFLFLNGNKISEGYDYNSTTLSIERVQDVKFSMELTSNQGSQHKINTTFSKLR